jgi:hypothetical protein
MNVPPEQSLLRVAFPSNATAQQTSISSATSNATHAQLRALEPASLLGLARNRPRNQYATQVEKGAQLDAQNKGVVVAHSELTSSVRFGGEYSLTEENHTEALLCALANCDSGLTCFQAIGAQILAEGRR